MAVQFGVKRASMIGNRRMTFVIDTDRRVLEVVKSDFTFAAHGDKALETLKRRQSGA